MDTARRKQHEIAGRKAESRAALYLRLRGYRIVERRFKTRAGEIDILARKGQILAVIEVKQRQTLAAAHDSLDAKSQNRIAGAVDDYLARTPWAQNMAIRYDAIFVIGKGRGKITHLKDAWRAY